MLAALAFLLALSCGSRWSGSVGAVLGKNDHDGRLFVRDAPPGMGAAKAGVERGDEIIAIDGKPVSSMTPADVHQALVGAVGSNVKITVAREGQTLTLEIERGPLRGE